MAKKAEEFNNLFDRFCKLMDQKTIGAQISAYSIAILGLSVAMRKMRPFTIFKNPSDIPNSFLKKRRDLTGVVNRIEPNGALLMVQHKPLIALPWKRSGELPVKVVGVNISGHGISWLQAIVSGNEVTFIPIKKDSNFIECEVILPQLIKKNKLRNVNVGESLVSVGFAQVADNPKLLLKNKEFVAYMNRLKIAENTALRKAMGFKYYIKPTTLIMLSVAKKLNNLVEKSVRIVMTNIKRKRIARATNVPKIAAT